MENNERLWGPKHLFDFSVARTVVPETDHGCVITTSSPYFFHPQPNDQLPIRNQKNYNPKRVNRVNTRRVTVVFLDSQFVELINCISDSLTPVESIIPHRHQLLLFPPRKQTIRRTGVFRNEIETTDRT